MLAYLWMLRRNPDRALPDSNGVIDRIWSRLCVLPGLLTFLFLHAFNIIIVNDDSKFRHYLLI
jgi:hypothetical protein